MLGKKSKEATRTNKQLYNQILGFTSKQASKQTNILFWISKTNEDDFFHSFYILLINISKVKLFMYTGSMVSSFLANGDFLWRVWSLIMRAE